MLGIHITVAVAWQRASAGHWATYAADVSRRSARRERTSQVSAPIEIADYDPRWPATFAALRGQVASVLGPLAQRIEHVGSTHGWVPWPTSARRAPRPISPLHLRPVRAVNQPEIQVQAVLDRLALGNGHEHQRRGSGSLPHLPGQVRRSPLPERDLDPPLLGAHHVVAAGSNPKRRLRNRVVTINNDLGEPAAHPDLTYPALLT